MQLHIHNITSMYQRFSDLPLTSTMTMLFFWVAVWRLLIDAFDLHEDVNENHQEKCWIGPFDVFLRTFIALTLCADVNIFRGDWQQSLLIPIMDLLLFGSAARLEELPSLVWSTCLFIFIQLFCELHMSIYVWYRGSGICLWFLDSDKRTEPLALVSRTFFISWEICNKQNTNLRLYTAGKWCVCVCVRQGRE